MRTNTELSEALRILSAIETPTAYNKADVVLVNRALCGIFPTPTDVGLCETGCANWIIDVDESGYWVFWEIKNNHSLTNVEPDTTKIQVAQKDGFSVGGAG